ncbi:MAG: hemolysin family protein [Chloroherpetonaceae bacterium]|nr:hemolysin family protein [Chloroherpetonaceae bacterium]
MTIEIILQNTLILWAVPLLLVLSAFFSGSEVALFSLTQENLKIRLRESPEDRSRIEMLLDMQQNPKRILVTLLIGNTLVNVGISVIMASFTHSLIQYYTLSPVAAYLTDILGVTFIILVFGEIVPKVVAVKHSERFAMISARGVLFFQILFYPLSETVLLLTSFVEGFILRIRGAEILAEKTLSEDDIETIAKIGLERTNLEDTEKELLTNLLDFRERQVRKIMTPRTEIVAISVEDSLAETLDIIIEQKRSRLPLYDGNLDNIVGVVYAKDLIKFLNSRKKFTKDDWLKIARQPIFVPETQHLDDVLREFQKRRMHLAIVVDEYGGTAGLLTLEDVILTIIGEGDFSPNSQSASHKLMPDGAFWLDASLSISEANELIGKSVFLEEAEDQSGDYTTVGGLVLHLAEDIPDEKSKIDYQNYEIEIEKVEGNRIVSILLRQKNNAPNETA